MSSKPQSETYGHSYQLPLVVGIIGHGDLDEVSARGIEAELRACFAEIKKRYPHTPTLALSSLESKAERLAARAARGSGARLIAVVRARPKQGDADFDGLIEQAERCVELPPIVGLPEESESACHNHVYAGAYIARHSHMLFAIRNNHSDHHGGVVDRVVRFKLEGVPEPYAPPRSPLDMWESGPVYNVGADNGSSLKKVAYPAIYEDEKTAEAAFYNIYRRIDMFNRDCKRLAPKLADRIEKSKTELFSGTELEGLTPELHLTRKYFGLADTLALRFQLKTRRTLLAVLALTFLVALVLKVSPLLPGNELLLNSLYLSSLVAAFGLYYAARRGEYQNKYQDYRALAEGLRVRFFWGLAGLKDSVADRYLRMQNSELDWIRSAIRTWSVPTGEHAGDACSVARPRDLMSLVLAHWVEDQHAYFVKTARRNGLRLKRLRRLANILFGVGVVWTVFEIIKPPMKWVPVVTSSAKWQGFAYCLTVALGLTPIVGILLFSYVRTSALAENTKQYGRMSTLFANARQCLSEYLRLDRRDSAEGVIRELGQEALAENGAWVFLHRQRPIDTPRPR
ncbi:MAG TPA: hypothetical protein VF131_26215 [Blastocatellia bacterium]|nr:hypothetical protein [Blastocatellia bacterium]